MMQNLGREQGRKRRKDEELDRVWKERNMEKDEAKLAMVFSIHTAFV